MIASIELQNFQSHKSSMLELTEGLNVIIGNSDSGKTAIIRSLNKLINNRPLGNEFQSYWGGDTLVTITTTEGNTVMLEITEGGKSKRYSLNGTDFKAFGTDVPEEIQQALNISEINLQAQFDSPFLLDSTPGEVAVHFNRIAHIDQIDVATKKVNSWLFNIQSVIGHASEKNKPATGLIRELETLTEQLDSFPDLNKIEIDIEVLENLQESRQNKINALSKLKLILKNIESTEQDIKEKSHVLKYEAKIKDLLFSITTNEANKKTSEMLFSAFTRLRFVERQIKTKNKIISTKDTVNNLLQIYSNRDLAVQAKMSLKNQLSLISNTYISIEKKVAEIERKQAIFKREMPDICPLCGK
jgi:hypothetical protein